MRKSENHKAGGESLKTENWLQRSNNTKITIYPKKKNNICKLGFFKKGGERVGGVSIL